MKSTIISLVLVGLLVLVGCSETPQEPGVGTVLVVASDPQVGPVSGVEVTLAPDNVTKTTDEAGSIRFVVPPGDYSVDAVLCCIGSGINYHREVKVDPGQTVKVELGFCLTCR